MFIIKRTFKSIFLVVAVGVALQCNLNVCAGELYETDIPAIIREFHAKELKYIDNTKDLIHYMYQSFLLGKGVVVAYTGKEKIILEDTDDFIEQVIRMDKPGLQDCESLWGNINGYNTAVSYSGGYTLICICPVYRHSPNEIREFNRALDEIAGSWNAENMSREQKTKLVHDYIVDNFDYDSSLINYDDYDGFYMEEGRRVMVCQGYALLTYKLLGRLDVPCRIVMSETHSWNIVQLEDGLWYHLDCTNDDLGIYGKQNVYDCFLKPEPVGVQHDYKGPCILYENLDGYEFGTRRYSRTEVIYILDRILIRHDLNYLMEKLGRLDIEFRAGCILVVSIALCFMVRRKQQVKKQKKEEAFLQYNKL